MDNYETVRFLGKGSYGEVFLVKHLSERRQYVVKKMETRDVKKKQQEAALLEAQLLAKLHHPNIVSHRESFQNADGVLHIVMGYCAGGDLHTHLRDKGSSLLDEQQIMDWFVQITLALDYLHRHNILHRDLKTQNIFLSKNMLIKVGDFGIARVLEDADDMAMTMVGTPYYMSPELFTNKPYNFKSDIWSCGCIVYEMVTLRRAFGANSLQALIMKVVQGKTPTVPGSCSKDLGGIIRAMLSQEPSRRPSADALLRLPFIKSAIKSYLSRNQRTLKKSAKSAKKSGHSSSDKQSINEKSPQNLHGIGHDEKDDNSALAHEASQDPQFSDFRTNDHVTDHDIPGDSFLSLPSRSSRSSLISASPSPRSSSSSGTGEGNYGQGMPSENDLTSDTSLTGPSDCDETKHKAKDTMEPVSSNGARQRRHSPLAKKNSSRRLPPKPIRYTSSDPDISVKSHGKAIQARLPEEGDGTRDTRPLPAVHKDSKGSTVEASRKPTPSAAIPGNAKKLPARRVRKRGSDSVLSSFPAAAQIQSHPRIGSPGSQHRYTSRTEISEDTSRASHETDDCPEKLKYSPPENRRVSSPASLASYVVANRDFSVDYDDIGHRNNSSLIAKCAAQKCDSEESQPTAHPGKVPAIVHTSLPSDDVHLNYGGSSAADSGPVGCLTLSVQACRPRSHSDGAPCDGVNTMKGTAAHSIQNLSSISPARPSENNAPESARDTRPQQRSLSSIVKTAAQRSRSTPKYSSNIPLSDEQLACEQSAGGRALPGSPPPSSRSLAKATGRRKETIDSKLALPPTRFEGKRIQPDRCNPRVLPDGCTKQNTTTDVPDGSRSRLRENFVATQLPSPEDQDQSLQADRAVLGSRIADQNQPSIQCDDCTAPVLTSGEVALQTHMSDQRLDHAVPAKDDGSRYGSNYSGMSGGAKLPLTGSLDNARVQQAGRVESGSTSGVSHTVLRRHSSLPINTEKANEGGVCDTNTSDGNQNFRRKVAANLWVSTAKDNNPRQRDMSPSSIQSVHIPRRSPLESDRWATHVNPALSLLRRQDTEQDDDSAGSDTEVLQLHTLMDSTLEISDRVPGDDSPVLVRSHLVADEMGETDDSFYHSLEHSQSPERMPKIRSRPRLGVADSSSGAAAAPSCSSQTFIALRLQSLTCACEEGLGVETVRKAKEIIQSHPDEEDMMDYLQDFLGPDLVQTYAMRLVHLCKLEHAT